MSPVRYRILLAVASVAALLGVVVVVAWPDDDGPTTDLSADGTTSTSTTEGSTTTSTEPATTSTTEPATTSSTAPGTTAAPAVTSPPTAPPPADPFSAARIRLTRVVLLDYPIAMAVRPSDGTLWVARKGGAVCRLSGGSCTQSQVVASVSTGNEQGLLGIAFSAGGSRLYVRYTNNPAGDTRLDSLAISPAGVIDGGSRQNLFSEDQPEANHNGGHITFGPDGRLYLGLGDGGGAGDQHGSTGNGQNSGTDLGKILRIDPSTGAVQRWISGVRNPWRFTFDRTTGDLWVGDVGQNAWEEVNRLPAGAQQGRNLGWRCFEGTHPYGAGCSPAGGHTPPLFDYPHGPGCSVTGGYVYRGSRIPALVGAYLYADFCDGRIRGVTVQGGRVRTARALGVNPGNVVSFGQDGAGELYVLTPSAVHRIDPG